MFNKSLFKLLYFSKHINACIDVHTPMFGYVLYFIADFEHGCVNFSMVVGCSAFARRCTVQTKEESEDGETPIC